MNWPRDSLHCLNLFFLYIYIINLIIVVCFKLKVDNKRNAGIDLIFCEIMLLIVSFELFVLFLLEQF